MGLGGLPNAGGSAALGEALLKIKTDTKPLEKGLKDAEKKAKVSSAKMADSLYGKGMRNALQKHSATLKSIGTKLTLGATLSVAGFGLAATLAASDFQAGMNKVEAVSGATSAEMASLRDLAKDLGSTTKFSASEAAEGMSFLSMAGFEANETMSAMPGLLSLAAAGGIELGEAADIASNVLSGFNENADQAGRVADVLAYTAASANTSVNQLGEAMSYVAPVAASVGLSIEDTAAMIGKLGDAGIQASRAGTGLRGMIAALLEPSESGAKALDKLGVAVRDAGGQMRPLPDIMSDLGAKSMDAQQAMAIFGRIAAPAAIVLSKAGDATKEFAGELQNADGAATKMADTMNKGLKGAWTEFKSAMEGLHIAIGEAGLVDLLEDIIRSITGVIRWLGQLPQPVLAAGSVIGGLVAVIGPAALALGTLGAALPALTAGFATAGVVLTGPVGLVAGFTALVGIGITAWFVHAEEKQEALREETEALAQALEDKDEILTSTLKHISNYADEVEKLTQNVEGQTDAVSKWSTMMLNLDTALLGKERVRKNLDHAHKRMTELGAFADKMPAKTRQMSEANRRLALSLGAAGRRGEELGLKVGEAVEAVSEKTKEATEAVSESVEESTEKVRTFADMWREAKERVSQTADVVGVLVKALDPLRRVDLMDLPFPGAEGLRGLSPDPITDELLRRREERIQAARELALKTVADARERMAGIGDDIGLIRVSVPGEDWETLEKQARRSANRLGEEMKKGLTTAAKDAADLMIGSFVTGDGSFKERLARAWDGLVSDFQNRFARKIGSKITSMLADGGSLGKLTGAFKGLFGGGAGAASAAGAAGGGVPSIPGVGGGGAGGAASAAGGGVGGLVNTISGVVTAISSVISLFQGFRTNELIEQVTKNQAAQVEWQKVLGAYTTENGDLQSQQDWQNRYLQENLQGAVFSQMQGDTSVIRAHVVAMESSTKELLTTIEGHLYHLVHGEARQVRPDGASGPAGTTLSFIEQLGADLQGVVTTELESLKTALTNIIRTDLATAFEEDVDAAVEDLKSGFTTAFDEAISGIKEGLTQVVSDALSETMFADIYADVEDILASQIQTVRSQLVAAVNTAMGEIRAQVTTDVQAMLAEIRTNLGDVVTDEVLANLETSVLGTLNEMLAQLEIDIRNAIDLALGDFMMLVDTALANALQLFRVDLAADIEIQFTRLIDVILEQIDGKIIPGMLLLTSYIGMKLGQILEAINALDLNVVINIATKSDVDETETETEGGFATGTDYVPSTGPYTLHRGEAVLNARENERLSRIDQAAARMESMMDSRGETSKSIKLALEIEVDDSRRLHVKNLKRDREFGEVVLDVIHSGVRTNQRGVRSQIAGVRSVRGAGVV